MDMERHLSMFDVWNQHHSSLLVHFFVGIGLGFRVTSWMRQMGVHQGGVGDYHNITKREVLVRERVFN